MRIDESPTGARWPLPLVVAVVLLIVIGASGFGTGLTLLSAAAGRGDQAPAGQLIGGGIGLYGLITLLSGLAVARGSRWAWVAAVAAIGLGVLVLAVVAVAAGFEVVVASGILAWGVTLVALLAPGTRRSMRR
jgi:hypothetical protein